MTTLRSALVAMACAVTVLLAGCSAGRHDASPSTDGPLRFLTPQGEPPGAGGSFPTLTAGQVHTTGLGELHNLGSAPATITDVRALVDTPGIDIIGALVYAKHQDSTDLANYADFPPVDPDLGAPAPVKGYVVPLSPQGDGYSVVVGYRATGVPRAAIKGFAVDYTVAGKRYTTISRITLAVCAPPTPTDRCKPEG